MVAKQRQSVEYNLAEIEILLDNNENDKKKIADIKNQINEIGFKNTAIKYSSSLSALEGGNIGWIYPKHYQILILKTVNEMKPGDISEPIFQSKQQHLFNY